MLFSSSGELVRKIDTAGNEKINNPQSVYVDKDGQVLLLDETGKSAYSVHTYCVDGTHLHTLKDEQFKGSMFGGLFFISLSSTLKGELVLLKSQSIVVCR